MLLAAGFSAPAPIEIPFAERVERAQQLRADGLSWAEIGELLGVGADTARRYVNVHSCECGEPILARDARLCRRCSSRHRTRWGRVFTEPEIIAAIRRWAKLEGRAPAIVDWRPADQGGHPRWERDCPRFPPRSHVTRRFGSWNAALQAAGFDRPRPPAWSDEEILARLRAWARERGFAPSSVEWDGSPDRDVISRRFGAWNAALHQAGLEPRFVRRRWTDEDILDGLRRWELDHGRPPRSMDRVGFGGEYPSPALVVTRFGSWRQALIAAGLEPGNPPAVTKEAIIDALRSYHANHGQSPTTTAWRAERQFPVSETIIRHCGSWRAALELAGLPPPDRTPRGPSDDEILDALRAYRRERGAPPTIREWNEQHRRPGFKLIRGRFGSWTAALARAGIAR
jgi:Homing endonuclease associated repeat